MADSSDCWLSQIVLDLRKENPKLKLHCFLPCEGQADKWNELALKRYHSILEQADSVTYVSHRYYAGCGGIRVRESRLFATREEAEAMLTLRKQPQSPYYRSPWD